MYMSTRFAIQGMGRIGVKVLKSFASLAFGFAALTLASTVATAAPPPIGYYRISARSRLQMGLDVAGNVNASGTNVDIYPYSAGPNQEWRLEKQTDGSYKLYAFSECNSLQVLDNGGHTANGGVVHTWEDLAVDGAVDTNQRWWMIDLGNGYYRLIPYASGVKGNAALEVTGVTGGAGALVEIHTWTGASNQQFKFTALSTVAVLPNPKKGLPTGTSLLDTAASTMHCSWTYNWSYTRGTSLAAGIEYVPMVWGWSSDTNIGNEVMAANPAAKNILGYNEPDYPNSAGGSNMPVATALTGFQYISALKSKGLGIVSPACAVDSDTWMKTFMSSATTAPRNYNIDYVGFHNYVSSTTAQQDINDFFGFIDYVHTFYNKPMWVTEFAPTNLSNAEALKFVRLACQGLQSRSYVIRYSMFTSEAPSSSGMGTSALVNADGSLTNCGQLYSRM